MQHTESEKVKIYWTKCYDRFRFLPGNRPINDRKIRKIMKEIDNGNDMLMYYPIQVKEENGKLWILDGQHRFKLSKFFQRHVYYIIVKEEKSMVEIAKVNSNVEKWTMDDFMRCYLEKGNPHYKELKNFMDKYDFRYSISLKLLRHGNLENEATDGSVNEAFREGTYTVDNLAKATELADLISLFKASGIATSKAFSTAISRIHSAGLMPVEEIYEAYSKYPHLLQQQINYKGYVTNLEQIVNHNKQKRRIIL